MYIQARVSIQHCLSCLRALHNYLDSTKLFSDLYLKFLDISAKSFFPWCQMKLILA